MATSISPVEFEVSATDAQARGLNKFQWEAICQLRNAKKNSPTEHLSHELGFNRLLDEAVTAMGMVSAVNKAPKEAVLSNGFHPRIAGVLGYGAERHALARTDELIQQSGLLKSPPAPSKAMLLQPDGQDLGTAKNEVLSPTKAPRKKLRFEVDAPLSDPRPATER